MSDVRAAKSAKWAAEILGCDLSRVYKLLRDGLLQGYRDGRAVRVYVDSIAQYQQSNEILSTKATTGEQRLQRRVDQKAHADAMDRLKAMGVLPDT